MEALKQSFNQMIGYKNISDTAKEFLCKLYAGVLESGYSNLEYHIKSEGELYSFCYRIGEQKYEFYTDDYYEFRIVKRIADQVVL